MANVLRPEKQLQVIQLLVEGNSVRSTERITGVHRDTICRLLVRVGGKARDFLDQRMRNLALRHVQADELWTFVLKKAARIPVDEKRENPLIGDQYVFIALDQDTKLIPSFVIGKRTADNARRFMVDLSQRLVTPKPHASDRHAFHAGGYRPLTQLSTDGFAGYPEAVDLAFGPYVRYGQLIKDYRNRDMPGRYSPGELVGSDRRPIFGDVDPFSICTSHVERTNLTIRTFIRRFTRLSLGFSKKLENLCAAVALHLAYYNFCWRPRMPGKSGRYRPTPAMMAGLTTTLWKLPDLTQALSQLKTFP
jgi:IS1 family transposase